MMVKGQKRSRLINQFKSIFNCEADCFSFAPGRINLIGEHTDYNMGYVYPAAIDKYMGFAFKKNESANGHIHALDLQQSISFDLKELIPSEYLWGNYLIGNLKELQKKGIQLSGFDCVFSSEIPMGSGMSSSAALECAFLIGVDKLFDLGLKNWDIVHNSHASNHNFLKIKSGILDQFASVFGKKDQAILLNCKDRSYQYSILVFEELQFVLVNSNVKHSHIESGYNDRTRECAEALAAIKAEFPQVENLSEVSLEQHQIVWNKTDNSPAKRARFILEENKRAISFFNSLNQADFQSCGQLLYESHTGLKDLYEVSCPEIDFLVDLTKPLAEVLGSRIMGGGFGGCTLNLIQKDALPKFKIMIKENYQSAYGIDPEIYEVNVAEGAYAE